MKLSSPKLFDQTTIDQEVAGKISNFISFINSNNEEIVRALRNQLTFADNMKGQTLTLTCVHGQPVIAGGLAKGAQVLGCIPLRVIDDSDSLTSHNFTFTAAGEFSFTAYFRLASIYTPRQITIFVLTS